MNKIEVVRARMASQGLGARVEAADPAEVVRRLGAVQAQDYLGGLWAVALRAGAAGEADVEAALARGSIVRTWPMRGTLHLVAAEDARWMLALLAPRVVAASAARERQLGLDAAVHARGRRALAAALRGGNRLTRLETYRVLERARIRTAGQRGYHVLWRLAHEGLICFGPREGKQQTFVLLDEWLPGGRTLAGDEALAELAARYFAGHGPATLQDFAWWSGLPAAEARAALELAKPRLAEEDGRGRSLWLARSGPGTVPAAGRSPRGAFLLPPFDELLVGYADRSDVVDSEDGATVSSLLRPAVLLRDHVAGTWRRAIRDDKVVISVSRFAEPRPSDARALAAAAARYGQFLGKTAALARSRS